jgi:MFS family permease
VLRFIQGVGVGGEWGGSVLLSMEWARNHRIARLHRVLAAVRRAGGLFLANLAVLAFSADVGRAVPDLGLAHPVPAQHRAGRVGLWIRLGILETPVFRQALRRAQKVEKTPMLEVIAHPKEICSRRSRAWPSRRRSTSSRRSSSPTAPAR